MNTLFADDLIRSPGPSLGAGAINLTRELPTEAEAELFEALSLSGSTMDPEYLDCENELFYSLGLSGPLLNFAKGVGQAVFNVGRGGRNLVRAVFQKPPLPTYNLKNGQLQTALDPQTKVEITNDGIKVGGEYIANASEVQSAYTQGYSDAGAKGGGSPGGSIDLPGVGSVPIQTAVVGGVAGLALIVLILKK